MDPSLERQPAGGGPWLPILVSAAGPTAAALLYMYGPRSVSGVRTAYFATKTLLFAFPLVWWWFCERPIPAQAQRAAWSPGRDLAAGAASGAAIGAMIWGAYAWIFKAYINAGILRAQVQAFGAYEYFAAYAAFLAVVNSGLEEYYWRWFVFGRLRRKLGVRPAVLISALAFAAHHFVVLQVMLGSLALAAVVCAGITAGGVIWAWHYHHSGRLGGVWLSHLLVDAAVLSVGHELMAQ